MYKSDKNNYLKTAKWIISIVTVCLLIYLGIRYIHVVVGSIWWVIQLVLPLLIGIVLALVLNIPLHFFENKVFSKWLPVKSFSRKRTLSILASLICIIGVIILAFFLVIPELIQAIITLVNICTDSIHTLSTLTNEIDYSSIPFGNYLEKINIDWNALSLWLQDLLPSFFNNIATQIPELLSSSLGGLVTLFLGIVFSIYILAKKETLKAQTIRLIHVWIPKKVGDTCMYIASVCTESFRNFIVGQTLEALILGSLCTLGMAILRLPYAPTIGVLVGVTAFIPYIGAYIGAVVGCIMILTVNPFKALVFVVFLVALQQVEGNVIYPKVVGHRINLPSIWVLAGLAIGGNLAGPIGMLLGVPAFSAAYNLITEATKKKEKQLLKSINRGDTNEE